jgi:ATP-dependent DNA ligase
LRTAPHREGWLHEIKFDGYRMHAGIERGDVRVLTRTGLNWTVKYAPIRRGPRQALMSGMSQRPVRSCTLALSAA